MVSDKQVLKLKAELNKKSKKAIAALRAGMARGTARKYAASTVLPSAQARPDRSYLTRPDPFEQDWPLLELMLTDAPELEAKALFEHLQATQDAPSERAGKSLGGRRNSPTLAPKLKSVDKLERERENRTTARPKLPTRSQTRCKR